MVIVKVKINPKGNGVSSYHIIEDITLVKNIKSDDTFKADYSFNKIVDANGKILFGSDKLGRFGIGNRRTIRNRNMYNYSAYAFIAYVPDNFMRNKKKYIGKILI